MEEPYNPANEICWSYAGTSSNTCGSTPTGGHTYSYDADGNETSNGNGLTMTYNALNQTTSATSGGTATDYSYISAGQNDLTADGSNTLSYSPLGVNALTNGSNTTNYDSTPNGQLLEERLPSGADYDYLYDGDGNIVGLTDSNGYLDDQYSYDPAGNKITNTGTVTNPFGFQGGYMTGSGLTHFGARYYNPAQMSWTQQDPLNQIKDLTQNDRYGFNGDDSINSIDPTGEGVGCEGSTAAECEKEVAPARADQNVCQAAGAILTVAGGAAFAPAEAAGVAAAGKVSAVAGVFSFIGC